MSGKEWNQQHRANFSTLWKSGYTDCLADTLHLLFHVTFLKNFIRTTKMVLYVHLLSDTFCFISLRIWSLIIIMCSYTLVGYPPILFLFLQMIRSFILLHLDAQWYC